jgi:hypothetical protein
MDIFHVSCLIQPTQKMKAKWAFIFCADHLKQLALKMIIFSAGRLR